MCSYYEYMVRVANSSAPIQHIQSSVVVGMLSVDCTAADQQHLLRLHARAFQIVGSDI